MEKPDPDFSLAAAFDLFDPAFRRFRPRQWAPEASDVEMMVVRVGRAVPRVLIEAAVALSAGRSLRTFDARAIDVGGQWGADIATPGVKLLVRLSGE